MELIYGKHSVRAVFMTRPRAIKRVILLDGDKPSLGEFAKLANNSGIKPEYMPWKQFLSVSDLTQDDKHQGVCVFAEPRQLYNEGDLGLLQDAKLVIALDQINNPQNLAAIIRTSAFFGADALFLLKNRSVLVTPTVTRVAVGGAEFIKIFKVTNLARSLDIMKKQGFWVYGFDESGKQTLKKTKFPAKSVLVIGAEGEGLRDRTRKFCDELVRIPGGRPGLESLNAGVAASIAIAEVAAQQAADSDKKGQ